MCRKWSGGRATPQTVYRIGSVTKQFTSSAVMQLVEEGKIGLDDEVTKYIPGYPTHGRRILVRHLLNHTSGIPSYTDVAAFGRYIRLDLPHDSLLAIVRDDSLQFDPGSHFYCNNTGYYMLGMTDEAGGAELLRHHGAARPGELRRRERARRRLRDRPRRAAAGGGAGPATGGWSGEPA